MPRPFPWLSRLPNIRRSVANSQRSHYGRRDLELLLGVSPAAAGRLLGVIATEPVGTAHLVARERLQGFLEAVSEAPDVAGLLGRMRAEQANLTRVKARYVWMRDQAAVPLCSLPRSIRLEPGRLEIRFDKPEELVERLGLLALAMEDDPLEFERACEGRAAGESAYAVEARWYQEEIRRMDAELGRGTSSAQEFPIDAGRV